MKKLLICSLICLLIQACVFDDDAFDDQVAFYNDGERVNFSDVDLELRTGFFSFDVGSSNKPIELNKECLDTSCTQTLFAYHGSYLDFSFIADGDWTGDLSQLPKGEIDQLLWTQVREANATVYFHEDYENTSPLLFTIKPSWADFTSGTSGNGKQAYYSSSGFILISLMINEYLAYDQNNKVLSADLSGTLTFRVSL